MKTRSQNIFASNPPPKVSMVQTFEKQYFPYKRRELTGHPKILSFSIFLSTVIHEYLLSFSKIGSLIYTFQKFSNFREPQLRPHRADLVHSFSPR